MIIITAIISFVLGCAVGDILSKIIKRKFVIKNDIEIGEMEPGRIIASRTKKKRFRRPVEFISEPTNEEVVEAERPKGLNRFFQLFVKPAKKEEEEEI